MTEEKLVSEKQDSIKISKTSRGYSWEIKLYYNNDEIEPFEINEQLQEIDKDLKRRFE